MIGCVVPSRVIGSVVRRQISHVPRPSGCVQAERVSYHYCAATFPLSFFTPRRRFIYTTTRLESTAIYSPWSHRMEWHKDDSLSSASVHEKEKWLESKLAIGDKRVDIEAFMLVLNALSTSDDASAPRRAEQWMKRLKEHRFVQPTTDAYQAVILAWANSNKEQPMVIVNRAQRWFDELLALSKADPESEQHLKPSIEFCNAFLDACTRGRSGNNKRDQRIVLFHAQKADALLRRLYSEYHHTGKTELAPNTDTFNFVLRGWTRCQQTDEVVQVVMGLLRLMEAHQQNNPTDSRIEPCTKTFTLVMDSLVRAAKFKARRLYSDGVVSDNPAFNGTNEMKEAEAILYHIHDLYDAGVEGVVPHRVPYNVLLTGWAALAGLNHSDAPFRAEEIIRRMFTHQDNNFLDAAPDRISYEKVMLAWANSGNQNAGKRAQWWLRKLWNDSELQGNKYLLPTVSTYNIAINAMATAEGAHAAEDVLLAMGDKYREEMSESLCPNSESFAVVIKAWLDKGRREHNVDDRLSALHRAVEWLTSLRQVENEKNLSTAPEQYHGILAATKRCARGRPEVLELAKKVVHDQRHSRHGLDLFSYARLLEVGLEALASPEADEERTAFIDDLFRDCCNDGLLGKHFVQAIVRSKVYKMGWTLEVYEDTMERLFHTWPLPPSWTRNIRSHILLAEEAHFIRNGYGHFSARPTMSEDNNDPTSDPPEDS